MRRTTPVLSTAAVVCGLLLIAPLPANAAETTANTLAELRTQIATANTNDPAEVDVIDLVDATYVLDGAAGNADVASGDLDITGDLTVNGNGALLDAALIDRFFDVASGTLTLVDVTIVNGVAPGTENGGAVRVAAGASLVVSGGAMNDSTAVNPDAPAATAGSGGAIATAGATTVTGASFEGNRVSRAGGAIEVLAGGSATVSDSDFTDNATAAAPGNGGALHITGAAAATVTGGTFSANAAAEGGALWNSAGGTLTVTDATIQGNTANGAAADQGGGGVFTEGGAVTITGGIIEGNDATGTLGSGGGIQNVNGTVTVTGTEITENTAVRAGGGVEAGPLLAPGTAAATTTTLTDVLLGGNTVTGPPGNGGGLHITGAGTVDVVDSTVVNNTAVEGGGLWNSAAGVLTVSGTTISNNTATGAAADQGGGGVFTEGGDVLIDTSDISGNDATGALGSGGGILNLNAAAAEDGSTVGVVVIDSTINGNTAVRAGGGIEAGPLVGAVEPTSTVLTGVALTGNTATGVGAPGNGGGFHLTGEGTVLVDTTLVADNTAVEGGGLWNSGAGSMAVTDSTIASNTATGTDGGGGLYQDGAGTITPESGLVAINVTITDNTADAGAGGAVLNAGTAVVGLLHATVTGNGSGIAGAVEIGNTVLTDNGGADADAGVTSVGGNVLDDALPFSTNTLPGATDTTGVSDPQLGELADNGGPTPTLLPATGSPVIDAGLPVLGDDMEEMGGTLIDTDQRGVTRPLDGNGDGRADVDAGSVEAPAIAVTPAPGGGGVTPPARPVPAQPNYTG